tara:strand:+ start:8832 stop:9143 length:312 start_codon:yes stop_codon:yes gene_type:complete
MIIDWLFYYLLLFGICFLFLKINNNKFISYFFIPILFGIFGAVWFIKPGGDEMAPIIAIFFLESSIIDSNGFSRLMRPLITFIFIFQLISLIIYLNSKNLSKS